MKKSVLMGIMLVAVMTTFTGCGETEKVIEGEAVVESTVQTAKETQIAENSEDAVEPADNSVAKGYAFVYQDVTLSIDSDASEVVEALPEALSYFEAASCAFEGLDKIYTYSGFEMDTYPQGEKDYISAVILKDDSVSTPEGVCVGDMRDKVEEAYGTEYVENENMLIYEKDGMQLRFILQGKSVVSIEYRSTILNEQ